MGYEACTILHVDMDAFYAAIEQRDRPELRGRPVVIGSPPDRRGVVSTASYEARKYGVGSAMPSRTAGRLCPHAIFLPVRMEHYAAVSRQVMDILAAFTTLVEQVSIDEAFLDINACARTASDPVRIAREIKARIRRELQLTASVGVAPNKFLAKLASDLRKPDGLTVVPPEPERIISFLGPLPVGRIFGIGPRSEERLARAGLRTIADIQGTAQEHLAAILGQAAARHALRLAHGEDSRPVVPEREEKSMSGETTFSKDCSDPDTVRQTLVELTERVGRRLRKHGKLAGTGQIKLRFHDFRTITRQQSLRPPTNSDRKMLHCALELLAREDLSQPVRLIGFGGANLSDAAGDGGPRQPLLLPVTDDGIGPADEASLDHAVDDIRSRYGPHILKRGTWDTDARGRPGAPAESPRSAETRCEPGPSLHEDLGEPPCP